MVPLDKRAQITQSFEFLEARLNAGAAPSEVAQIAREYSELKPVAEEIATYRQPLTDLADAELMLSGRRGNRREKWSRLLPDRLTYFLWRFSPDAVSFFLNTGPLPMGGFKFHFEISFHFGGRYG